MENNVLFPANSERRISRVISSTVIFRDIHCYEGDKQGGLVKPPKIVAVED